MSDISSRLRNQIYNLEDEFESDLEELCRFYQQNPDEMNGLWREHEEWRLKPNSEKDGTGRFTAEPVPFDTKDLQELGKKFGKDILNDIPIRPRLDPQVSSTSYGVSAAEAWKKAQTGPVTYAQRGPVRWANVDPACRNATGRQPTSAPKEDAKSSQKRTCRIVGGHESSTHNLSMCF